MNQTSLGSSAGKGGSTATDRRRERTLRDIYTCAARLAAKDELDGMSMKDFAAAVGVAVNTIKRNGFEYVSDVADSLVEQPEVIDTVLTPAAIDHLKVAGRQSAARSKRVAVHRAQQLASDIRGRVQHGHHNVESAIATLEAEHARLAGAHADEGAVLAEMSNALAELHLDHAADDSTGESFVKAYSWVNAGIKEFKSDSRSRNFTLGVKLTQNGLRAARGLIDQINRDLPAEPSESDISEARLAVAPHFLKVALLMIDEHRYCTKLNHPVGAANAEFHRRRAEALLAGGEAGQREEIEAVFEMGRVLRNAGRRIPDDVLRTFLPRVCATQVAYPDSMSAEEHKELDSIRRHLVDVIDGDKSKAMKRAFQTLFALAEVDLGRCDAHSERPPDHLSDLVVVTTFGAVGRVLVADHLLRAAETAGTQNALYKESDFLSISGHDFRRAARYWYRKAPRNMNVSGASFRLSERARDSLHSSGLASESEPDRWAILDEDSDGLNMYFLKQLAVGAVTSKPPTKKQAENLLDELEPFLTVLRSISQGATEPAFR
ncbi:hypothetical protein [Rhodococcoides fascians]|uniref:hypothetical protein n=1 Tax=Rhodococcoides fascians TaxID=1828 RepID=UPI00050C4B5D|nr:hypothetical protein [Rhodococcus fascians]